MVERRRGRNFRSRHKNGRLRIRHQAFGHAEISHAEFLSAEIARPHQTVGRSHIYPKGKFLAAVDKGRASGFEKAFPKKAHVRFGFPDFPEGAFRIPGNSRKRDPFLCPVAETVADSREKTVPHVKRIHQRILDREKRTGRARRAREPHEGAQIETAKAIRIHHQEFVDGILPVHPEKRSAGPERLGTFRPNLFESERIRGVCEIFREIMGVHVESRPRKRPREKRLVFENRPVHNADKRLRHPKRQRAEPRPESRGEKQNAHQRSPFSMNSFRNVPDPSKMSMGSFSYSYSYGGAFHAKSFGYS